MTSSEPSRLTLPPALQMCFLVMRPLSFLCLIVAASVWGAKPTPAAPLELLTAKEAAQPNLPNEKNGLPAIGEMPSSPGAPKIIVDQPAQNTGLNRPFPIKIRFVPSGGAKINLDSVEVDVLKLIKISLVSRLRAYLSPTGIDVREAQIPSGTYNLHIAVTDDHGRRTEKTQTWTVL